MTEREIEELAASTQAAAEDIRKLVESGFADQAIRDAAELTNYGVGLWRSIAVTAAMLERRGNMFVVHIDTSGQGIHAYSQNTRPPSDSHAPVLVVNEHDLGPVLDTLRTRTAAPFPQRYRDGWADGEQFVLDNWRSYAVRRYALGRALTRLRSALRRAPEPTELEDA